MRFIVEGERILIETDMYKAELIGARLVKLTNRLGCDIIDSTQSETVPALELVDCIGNTFPIGTTEQAQTRVVRVNQWAVDVFASDWEADAVVRVELDAKTGDLLITPAITALRKGVAAVRWNVSGIDTELDLVAPIYQGIRAKLEDPLITGERWRWPLSWEAGLAIMQGADSGFSVSCYDTRFRYKGLMIGHRDSKHVLGFDTEAYGPLHDNQAAGGVCWRINVHGADWHAPAEKYREWLWDAYSLEEVRSKLPEWKSDITLAVSWCPSDLSILDALTEKNPPARTLLHVPHWRKDRYDVNYPCYEPSEKGIEFIAKARGMGFRVMPHFNYTAVDPSHPCYNVVAPHVFRDVRTGRLDGWGWPHGKYPGVPQSGSHISTNQRLNVMAYVHSGLSWWRAFLRENIASAVSQLNVDSIFTDQTLVSWNLQNCLVEDMTSTEGMWTFTREVTEMGLSISGEGLNEISMQYQAFAQAHLFKSHVDTVDGLDKIVYPVNSFLFEGLCRTIGYSNLHGKDEKSKVRIHAHQKQGAIPTVTVQSAAEITSPNPVIKEVLERAGDSK